MQDLPDLVSTWRTDPTRQLLLERMKKNRGVMEQASEQQLAQQYFRYWLEIPTNNPLQKLVMHPLLTKADHSRIEDFLSEQKTSQVQYSAGFTAGTLCLYWLFLNRTPTFQRIFNNRAKSRVVNGLKKVAASYAMFLGWVLALNQHYEKTTPQGLDSLGLFAQYGIHFEDKNV